MEQNIVEPKKKNRKKLVSIIIFIIILTAIGYFIWIEASDWWRVRKEYVRMGFAEDKFPYRMYTERELVEKGLWPVESQELMNTPTRTRPEETYAKFRQALIDGDINKAAGYFAEEKREEIRDGLRDVLNDKDLKDQMLKDLPEKIEGVKTFERSLTYYEYSIIREGKKWIQTMSFIKNWDGDWLIEDL